MRPGARRRRPAVARATSTCPERESALDPVHFCFLGLWSSRQYRKRRTSEPEHLATAGSLGPERRGRSTAHSRRAGSRRSKRIRDGRQTFAGSALDLGTTYASQPTMTLPYPYEVETGQLKPRPRFVLRRFDVERHLRDAIRSRGEAAELFGVQYPLVEPCSEELLERLRAELSAHFYERVASPDAEVWRQFADQARAQLERHARLQPDVLHTLRATIDGL